ncbi:MAG TPA: purine-nucleoside phosphorylase [Streptosporangiaceae bacterium]|nr:purine-nucleoside phosphorylase [Streptosporangiaceae bacterium]
MTDAYAAAQAGAAKLAEITGQPSHDVAVVLGSGWLPAADAIGHTAAEFPLSALGGFAEPTVAGHAPVARSVLVGPLRVLVYLGRTHLYEGHPVDAVVHGVRTAAAAGCRVIILTNASGGINESYQVGQPVLLSDHLNLTGRSPMTGPEPPAGFASRFVDLTDLYSSRLRALARQADPDLAEGVYAALHGPHYETPAEIRMLRGMGADMVGMSTALEAIAARHRGVEVLGVSLVTNPAAGLSPSGLNHAEVIAAGQQSAARVGALLAQVIPGTTAAVGPRQPDAGAQGTPGGTA